MAKSRAKKYFENKKKILTAGDAASSFFKNAKAYNSKEKPPNFNVTDLYPGADSKQVAENLAQHFNAISNEFQGLTEDDIPNAPSLSLPLISGGEVAEMLRKFKKPKSMVRGDIFPSLVNLVAEYLAIPLSNIYNSITASKVEN